MVSGSVSFVVGFASVLGLAAVTIWRHDANLEDKYSDDFYDFQAYRWSEFSSELGELITEVNRQTDFNPSSGDQRIPPQSEVVTVINDDIGRERMEEIEEGLRSFDRPQELKDEAREKYKQCYRYLALASAGFFVTAFLMGFLPASERIWQIELVIAIFSGYLIIQSVIGFRGAYGSEGELDELIDQYRSPA